MDVRKSRIDGLLIIEPKLFRDERGFFTESYSQRTFDEAKIDFQPVQDNHSLSVHEGTIRGLHYQLDPMGQTKIVKVLVGAIFDVAVDIRRGSQTFGQWHGEILTATSGRQMMIPAGFAHGFCSLVPNTEVFYKVDQFYAPEYDRGIRFDDPALGIKWPFSKLILSDKDRQAPTLAEAEINFVYGK